MNVTTHQEKKKKETKTDKIRSGEKKKRKQAADFKEVECCPSAVAQRAT